MEESGSSKFTTIEDKRMQKRKSSSQTSSSIESEEDEMNKINSDVSNKLHQIINRNQGKWHVNGLKEINYQDQRVDQRVNRHIKYGGSSFSISGV
jgi:hypothetical protein